MAAINFPDSPSNGDTHTVGGVTYTYNSAETKWKTTINSNAFLPLTGGTVSGNILMGGEIQHDGDTDTNISFDTDTILFDTAGSERFRVGSAGQLGIGGATYGTSGQVLTSGGASAAPTWAAVENTQAFAGARSENPNATAVEWTGIGPDVQWICAGYNDAYTSTNTNGSERTLLQVGTGSTSWKTSNYQNYGYNNVAGGDPANGFSGAIGGINPYFWINNSTRETTMFFLQRQGDTNNWSFHLYGAVTSTYLVFSNGYFSTSADLTAVRFTTHNGTANLNGSFWMNYGVR